MGSSTAAKDASIGLGPFVTATGKFVTTRKSDSDSPDSFHHVCPTCGPDKPTRLSLRRVCNDFPDTHIFTEAECPDRCKENANGDLVYFTGEEVAGIKAGDGIAGKHLALNVHSAGDVDHLRPTGLVYLFVPNPAAEVTTSTLMALLEEGDIAFLGKVTLRRGGKTKIFRLRATTHGLELVEVANPDGVFVFDDVDYPVADGPAIVMASRLIEAYMAPFDPAAYRSDVAERIDAAMAAKAGNPVATVTSIPTAAPVDNLEGQLVAALAAAGIKEAA